MAKMDQTIKVSGLPLDIPENRLIDKLHIHFLRKRNGGGDISSIKISESGYAIITFDDSKVAHRVVQKGSHTLQFSDDKKYTVLVSWYRRKTDPDELFVDIAVTVDYSKLPGGKKAIVDLHRTSSGVKSTFSSHEETCTFKGRYSEVQGLTKSLLSLLDSENQNDFRIPNTQVSDDQKTYHSVSEELNKQFKRKDLVAPSKLSYDTHNKSQIQQQSYRNEKEKAEELEQITSPEDFSMVMDTDIFCYLKSHCSTEYQRILEQHGVDVLDVSSNEITTLYLRAKAGDVVQSMQCIRSANVELSRLYQEKEAQLQKVQLSKDDLPRQGLQQNLEVLVQTFPKLSINDEGPNIYLVGSGGDVSEAKQFLLNLLGTTKEHSQRNIPKNTLFQLSGAASPLIPEESPEGSRKEINMSAGFTNPVRADDSTVEKLWSSTGDRKTRQEPQSLLLSPAAHFRSDSQIFDNEPTSDIGSVQLETSNPKEITDCNPKDKADLCEKIEDSSFISRGGHSISKDLNHCTETKTLATLNNSHSNPSNHVNLARDSGSLSVPDSHSVAGFPQTRFNSLEWPGQVRTEEKLNENLSEVPLVEKTGESQVNSQKQDYLSNTKEALSVKVKVPLLLWLYIKHCYCMKIENLTADLQMRESKEMNETILHLRGADPTKVKETQRQLTDLITKVAEDFSSNELMFSSVGISDHTSETLKLKCAIVMEKFRSLLILPLLKSIFILGPKHDGLEAITVLNELFLTGFTAEKSNEFLQGYLAAGTSRDDTKLQKTPTDHSFGEPGALQSFVVQDLSDSHETPVLKPLNEKVKLLEIISFKSHSAPSQLDHSPTAAIEEKNERAPSLEGSTQRLAPTESGRNVIYKEQNTEPYIPTVFDNAHNNHNNRASKPIQDQDNEAVCPWCQGKVNPYCSVCPKSDTMDPQSSKEKDNAGDVPEDKQAEGIKKGSCHRCVCGTTGDSVSIKACEAVLCPACEAKIHSDCGVCSKAAEERVIGIRGTMTCNEMSMSLAGHSNDTTLKITYSIPDGFQGKDHPNPGATFQGGHFQAFLPLNDMTRQLWTSLKQAFEQGLTFRVRAEDTGDKVVWGHIPHKTSIDGGKSKNGYPDSGYLKRLKDSLKQLNVEEC